MYFRAALLVAAALAPTFSPRPPPAATPDRGAPGRGAPGRGAPPIKSPEIAPDGKVTPPPPRPQSHREASPPDSGPRLALEKDDQGVWAVTTDPLKPDIYLVASSQVDAHDRHRPLQSQVETRILIRRTERPPRPRTQSLDPHPRTSPRHRRPPLLPLRHRRRRPRFLRLHAPCLRSQAQGPLPRPSTSSMASATIPIRLDRKPAPPTSSSIT